MTAKKTTAKTETAKTETAKIDAAKTAETVVATAQEQVEKASKVAYKAYDDVTSFNKDAFDAVVQSSTIVAKGYEAIGKEVMSFTQIAVEANVAATKALFGVKNLREALDLQAEYTRASMDKALAESAKLSEMSFNVAKDAFEPIQTRVNTAVESVMKRAA